MPIIPKPSSSPPRTSADGRPNLDAWLMLSWVGIAFVVMGVTDIALGWYPPSFGNAEWEFGAISATLNGFALPTLGLYLILATSLARRSRLIGRALSIALACLTLTMITLGVIYLTVIPLALSSVAANEMLTAGMRKAVIKASVLFVAYVVLFGLGAIQAWRAGGTEAR